MTDMATLIAGRQLPQTLKMARLLLLLQGGMNLLLTIAWGVLIALLDSSGRVVADGQNATTAYIVISALIWVGVIGCGLWIRGCQVRAWRVALVIEACVFVAYLVTVFGNLGPSSALSALLPLIVIGLLVAPSSREALVRSDARPRADGVGDQAPLDGPAGPVDSEPASSTIDTDVAGGHGGEPTAPAPELPVTGGSTAT